ncbi:hypothetical protein [Streptomyces sp. S.PB5]|uniref:hypothetical protein n=1 Tax=Streptomyces sp. S.PB5 TaxID=3020844 RepID=UPI0025AF6FE0|nr:hypothetical protein [Streptomyces sp. S.PB5]MDN3023549.1 hypothetical protein [Streptomyces sp. S.PB5]
MTAKVPDRTTSGGQGREPAAGRRRFGEPGRSRRRQGPSPLAGECLRPLTRLQVEDRTPELGDLYARISGGEPWAEARARSAFLRRLAADVRRPGFALLVAECAASRGGTVLTGCAHGFPVRGDGPWWRGLYDSLPLSLRKVAEAGRLFAISEILVGRRVRTQDQDRDWNLARRLQQRLLTDHAATLGVTLVNRGDSELLEALWSWGWRYVPAAHEPLLAPSCRVLVVR